MSRWPNPGPVSLGIPWYDDMLHPRPTVQEDPVKATPETPLDDLRRHGIAPPFDVVLHDGAWYVTAHASRADDTPRTILEFVDEVRLGARGNVGAIRRLVELLNLGVEVIGTDDDSGKNRQLAQDDEDDADRDEARKFHDEVIERSSPLTTLEVIEPDARAVSVRFIGWLPHGQRVADVDPRKVTEQLRRVFGFTSVTRLTVTDQVPSYDLPKSEPDPAYDHPDQSETC